MTVNLEINIPPHFFDSADRNNDFESVSEKFVKAVLVSILGKENIRRGNPQAGEPDYIDETGGYEVTLAITDNLIPQMVKGIYGNNGKAHQFEMETIQSIENIVKKKSEKVYNTKCTLVVVTLIPLFSWISSLYGTQHSIWKENRNALFHRLYQNYIKEQASFANILILHPTFDEKFVLYDLNKYNNSSKEFESTIAVKDGVCKHAFPLCRVTSCNDPTPPTVYNISFKRYIKKGTCDEQI